MNIELTEENFLIYAMKHYDNPSCTGIGEFQDDLKRFRYLKRLFRKNQTSRGPRERLILNHLVVIYNLFGVEAATNMLFYKIESKFWPQLKAFLVFLNYMPIGKVESQEISLNSYEIPIDQNILDVLGKI